MKKNYIFCFLLIITVIFPVLSQMDSARIHDIAIAKFLEDAQNIEKAMLNAEKVINAMQELLALQWWWGILASVILPVPVIIAMIKIGKQINIKRDSLFQIYKKINDNNIDEAKTIVKNEYESKMTYNLWIWIWASVSVIVLTGWVFMLGYSNV